MTKDQNITDVSLHPFLYFVFVFCVCIRYHIYLFCVSAKRQIFICCVCIAKVQKVGVATDLLFSTRMFANLNGDKDVLGYGYAPSYDDSIVCLCL